jgi:hypothetical protein
MIAIESSQNIFPSDRVHIVHDNSERQFSIIFHRANERLDLSQFQGQRIFSNVELTDPTHENCNKEYRLEIARSSGEIQTPFGYMDVNTELPNNSIFFIGTTPSQIREIYERINGKLSQDITRSEIEASEKYDKDLLIASSVIDKAGQIKVKPDDEAYLLYWKVLSGDTHSYDEMLKRKQILNDMREQRQELIVQQTTSVNDSSKVEPLSIKDLVLVHTTKYLPLNNRIYSTFDTRGIPRNTIHFSLNHLVSDHVLGTWSAMPYVIIAPLESSIQSNGSPSVLNTVDTFFETYPGEGFSLPEGFILVKPAEKQTEFDNDTDIFKIEDNTILYKTEFTMENISRFLDLLSREEKAGFNQEVFRKLMELLYNYTYTDDDTWITEEQYNIIVSSLGDILNPRDFVSELRDKQISDIIIQLFNTVDIINPKVSNIVDAVSTNIISYIIKTIRDMTVNYTIENILGYQKHGGGMWAWDNDSSKATDSTRMLGAELSIPVMAHNAHITHKFNDFYLDIYKRRQTEGITAYELRQSLFEFIQKNFDQMSNQMLHMILNIGGF